MAEKVCKSQMYVVIKVFNKCELFSTTRLNVKLNTVIIEKNNPYFEHDI